MKRVVIMLVAVLFFSSVSYAQDLGVYVKAVEKAQGSFDEVVKGLEGALAAAGWEVVASYESGVEKRCGLRAHNVVFFSADYAKELLSVITEAAFAVVLRAAVYEDEAGINVAFMNPASTNRTVLGDGVKKELSAGMMKQISEAVSGSVKGSAVNTQIGQIRGKGKVGGMGGGNFLDKIEVVHTGGDLADVAGKVKGGIEANSKGWRLVYTLKSDGTVIHGVTRAETEARAFGIAGEQRQKKDYKCPGLDHAPAFPIEVAVYSKGGVTNVATLDEMYRMKLFFEDAGNWAFMKNMTMPGAIEDDIVEMSVSKLK